MDEWDRFFNPNDVSAWKDIPLEQILPTLLAEAMMPIISIKGYATILTEQSVADVVAFESSSGSMTVGEMAEKILYAADRLLRMRETLMAVQRDRNQDQ